MARIRVKANGEFTVKFNFEEEGETEKMLTDEDFKKIIIDTTKELLEEGGWLGNVEVLNVNVYYDPEEEV